MHRSEDTHAVLPESGLVRPGCGVSKTLNGFGVRGARGARVRRGRIYLRRNTMSAATAAKRSSRRISEEVAPETDTVNKRRETATSAGGNGRDGQGRFTAGNPGGPGNPFARRMAQLRSVMLQCITDEDMQAITHALLLKARNGDLAAIKLMCQYSVGKPTEAVNPDTLDIEEYNQIYRPQKEIMEDAPETMRTIPPGALTPVVRAMNRACMNDLGTLAAAPPEMQDEVDRDPRGYLNRLARQEAATAVPAAETYPEPQGQEDADNRQRAPSTNRSNDDAVARRSTNGGRSTNRANGSGSSRPSTNGDPSSKRPNNAGSRRSANGSNRVERPSPNRGNGDTGSPPSTNGGGYVPGATARDDGGGGKRRRCA
jgi:hypothetical protein